MYKLSIMLLCGISRAQLILFDDMGRCLILNNKLKRTGDRNYSVLKIALLSVDKKQNEYAQHKIINPQPFEIRYASGSSTIYSSEGTVFISGLISGM